MSKGGEDQMANNGTLEERNEEEELLRREKPEIERLSDLIFGLALSIGALVLISRPPSTSQEILIDIAYFSFSFFILIVIWMRYMAAMAFMKVESVGLIRLNIALLFLVSLEPYLFFLLASGPSDFSGGKIDDIASMLFALDLAALMAILAFFSGRIAMNEGMIHPVEVRKHLVYRLVFYTSSAVILISLLPIFWQILIFGIPLRFFLWVGSIMVIVFGIWYAGRL
jgi:uncharacterized membrane protein